MGVEPIMQESQSWVLPLHYSQHRNHTETHFLLYRNSISPTAVGSNPSIKESQLGKICFCMAIREHTCFRLFKKAQHAGLLTYYLIAHFPVYVR